MLARVREVLDLVGLLTTTIFVLVQLMTYRESLGQENGALVAVIIGSSVLLSPLIAVLFLSRVQKEIDRQERARTRG